MQVLSGLQIYLIGRQHFSGKTCFMEELVADDFSHCASLQCFAKPGGIVVSPWGGGRVNCVLLEKDRFPNGAAVIASDPAKGCNVA